MKFVRSAVLALFVAKSAFAAQMFGGELGNEGYENMDTCTNTAAHGGVDEGCGREYNPICVDINGAELPAGVDGVNCVPCLNTELDDGKADYGCTDERPRCVGSRYKNPKLWDAGLKCVGNKERCKNDAQNGWPWNGIDEGCYRKAPVCIGGDGEELALGDNVIGKRCVACRNTPSPGSDEGCPWNRPKCVMKGRQERKGYKCMSARSCFIKRTFREPPEGAPGDMCVPKTSPTCTNTEANQGYRTPSDKGCTKLHKMCVSKTGGLLGADVGGDHCVQCVNTKQSDSGIDEGCHKKVPRCVSYDRTNSGRKFVNPSLNTAGDRCVKDIYPCKNTAGDGNKDFGCDKSAPICVDDNGGLLSASTYGAKCVKCMNTQQGTGSNVVDSGCSEYLPRCVTKDGSEPALNYEGYRCIEGTN
jgi:hypothetical protein